MKWLTEWAVTSSVLILIVLAVRWLLRDRLSARLRYALWGVVMLRLLVPFQVELPAAASLPVLASNFVPEVADVELYALRTNSRSLSEDNLAEMRERGVDPGTVIGTEAPIHHIGDVEIEGYAHCFVLSETGVDTYFFYTTLPRFLMTLWVIGMVWVALTIFHSNRYFYGRLKYYRHELEGAETPVPVYTAANLSSPCLFGVFRPAVYVTPAAAENPDTLRHVLAHELTHYAHFDHIWSLLRILALALHWYNPLVWLAVGLSKRDGELACDEGAVVRLGEDERIPYGRTLVDMVAARSLRPGDLLSCSTAMTGGRKSIQERVARLVQKPETVKAALFAAVAVVAVAAVFVFAGRAQPKVNTMFQDQVGLATSIHYGPPLYSSTFYPYPISDEALLAQAKEALRSAAPLGPEDPEPDRGTLIHASTVSLTLEDGSSVYYTLLRQNSYTYVLEGAVRYWYEDTQQDPWYSTAFRSEEDIISILESLARQQKYQEQEELTPADYDYNRYHAQLEAARSIYVGQPAVSSLWSPGLISDPEAVAQAKELLRKVRPSIQLQGDITWEELRKSFSYTEYYDMEEPPLITQEDLEDMLFMWGRPVVLCPDEEYQFSEDYQYFLCGDGGSSILLYQKQEQGETSIEILGTFSDDVYSQLSELAQN